MTSLRGLEPEFLCHFGVTGINPAPQGSKSLSMRGGKPRMFESNKGLPEWRAKVKAAAKSAMEEVEPIMEGPVKVRLMLYFPRLKSHFDSKGNLRNDAPTWKPSTPDTDKLQRAVGDALSGVCYRDDAQVAWWDARRVYSVHPGAAIWVYALPLGGGTR